MTAARYVLLFCPCLTEDSQNLFSSGQMPLFNYETFVYLFG